MPDFRVLITGCRDWSDRDAVRSAMEASLSEGRCHASRIVFVHGDCPTGTDAIASDLLSDFIDEVGEERHPADWRKHVKAAGPIRNREMAKAGADLCLAFWDGDSRGTLNCIAECVRTGIPVRIIPKARRDA